MPTVKNAGKFAMKQVAAGVKQGIKDQAQETARKTSTLKPGKFASESVPARGPGRDFTAAERNKINEIGQKSGCHTCGNANPGTKSGNFIPDHQPANALNKSGGPQKLYPHCKTCSGTQAGQLTQAKKKLNE